MFILVPWYIANPLIPWFFYGTLVPSNPHIPFPVRPRVPF